MIKKEAILVILVFLTVGGGLWLFDKSDKKEQREVMKPSPGQTSTLTPTPTDNEIALPEDWTKYEAERGWSISHPKEFEVEDLENGINISKWGPTQKENTEFYDGISLTIRSQELAEEETVEEVARNSLEEFENSPVYEDSSELTTMTLADRAAYTYSATSLGTRRYYFVRANSYCLEIVDGTTDPTNQGFSDTVEEILSSLDLK